MDCDHSVFQNRHVDYRSNLRCGKSWSGCRHVGHHVTRGRWRRLSIILFFCQRVTSKSILWETGISGVARVKCGRSLLVGSFGIINFVFLLFVKQRPMIGKILFYNASCLCRHHWIRALCSTNKRVAGIYVVNLQRSTVWMPVVVTVASSVAYVGNGLWSLECWHCKQCWSQWSSGGNVWSVFKLMLAFWPISSFSSLSSRAQSQPRRAGIVETTGVNKRTRCLHSVDLLFFHVESSCDGAHDTFEEPLLAIAPSHRESFCDGAQHMLEGQYHIISCALPRGSHSMTRRRTNELFRTAIFRGSSWSRHILQCFAVLSDVHNNVERCNTLRAFTGVVVFFIFGVRVAVLFECLHAGFDNEGDERWVFVQKYLNLFCKKRSSDGLALKRVVFYKLDLSRIRFLCVVGVRTRFFFFWDV